jgi:hypothetical protein
MLFSLHEFIFLFLTLALAAYFVPCLFARKAFTLFWLIGASLTFYAVWNPWNLLGLCSSIGLNFSCGMWLAERAREKKPRGLLLAVGVAVNLGLICCFKYSGFFATNLNAAAAIPLAHVRGPHVLPDSPAIAIHSDFAASDEINITSAMLDAIIQNTPGYSEGYPVGVPKAYSWCSGSYKPPEYSAPPSNFTAVTGWGAVYPKAGAPAYSNPNATVEIANAKTYVKRNKTGEWVLVQDQATNQIAGRHFLYDFAKNAAIEMKMSARPDRSVALAVPPTGYNNHFWPSKRGTFPAGEVIAAYVQMDMRVSDPHLRLIANVGADWWLNATAKYVHGFANNPGAGMSNWTELSTQWSTLRFYSWSTSQFQAAPPPPLVGPASKTQPTITRRRATSSSPCL